MNDTPLSEAKDEWYSTDSTAEGERPAPAAALLCSFSLDTRPVA